MKSNQIDFDFKTPASEDGYHKWRQEVDAQRAAFEKRWGIIIGQRVSVKLFNYDKPLEGVLFAKEEPNRTKPGKQLTIHLGTHRITLSEIESILRIESPERDQA